MSGVVEKQDLVEIVDKNVDILREQVNDEVENIQPKKPNGKEYKGENKRQMIYLINQNKWSSHTFGTYLQWKQNGRCVQRGKKSSSIFNIPSQSRCRSW